MGAESIFPLQNTLSVSKDCCSFLKMNQFIQPRSEPSIPAVIQRVSTPRSFPSMWVLDNPSG